MFEYSRHMYKPESEAGIQVSRKWWNRYQHEAGLMSNLSSLLHIYLDTDFPDQCVWTVDEVPRPITVRNSKTFVEAKVNSMHVLGEM